MPQSARPCNTRPTRVAARLGLRLIELTSEGVAVTGLREFSDRAEEINHLIDEELTVRYRRFLSGRVTSSGP